MNIATIYDCMEKDYVEVDGQVLGKKELKKQVADYFSSEGIDPKLASKFFKFITTCTISFKTFIGKPKKGESDEEFEDRKNKVIANQDALLKAIFHNDFEDYNNLNPDHKIDEAFKDGLMALFRKKIKEEGCRDSRGSAQEFFKKLGRVIDLKEKKVCRGNNIKIKSGDFDDLIEFRDEIKRCSNIILEKTLLLNCEPFVLDETLVDQKEVNSRLKKLFKSISYDGTFEEFLEEGKAFYRYFVEKEERPATGETPKLKILRRSTGLATMFSKQNPGDTLTSKQYRVFHKLKDSGYLDCDFSWTENKSVKYAVVNSAFSKLRSYSEIKKEYDTAKAKWLAAREKFCQEEESDDLINFLTSLLEDKHGNIKALKDKSFKGLVRRIPSKKADGKKKAQVGIKELFEGFPEGHKFDAKDSIMFGGYNCDLIQFLFDNKELFYRLEDSKVKTLVEENYHWRKDYINISSFKDNVNILLGKNVIRYKAKVQKGALSLEFKGCKEKAITIHLYKTGYLQDLEIIDANDINGIYSISYSPDGRTRYTATFREPAVYYSFKRKQWEVRLPLSNIIPHGRTCKYTAEEQEAVKSFMFKQSGAKNASPVPMGEYEMRVLSVDRGLNNPVAYSVDNIKIKDRKLISKSHIESGLMTDIDSQNNDVSHAVYVARDTKKLIRLSVAAKRFLHSDPDLEPFFKGVVNKDGYVEKIHSDKDRLEASARYVIEALHRTVNSLNRLYERTQYYGSVQTPNKIDLSDLINEIVSWEVLSPKNSRIAKQVKYYKDNGVDIDIKSLTDEDILTMSIYCAKVPEREKGAKKKKAKRTEKMADLKLRFKYAMDIASVVRNENLDAIKYREDVDTKIKTSIVTGRTYKKLALVKETIDLKKTMSKVGNIRTLKQEDMFCDKDWDYVNGLRRNIATYTSSAIISIALEKECGMIVMENLDAKNSAYADRESNRLNSLFSSGDFSVRTDGKAEKHGLTVHYVSPYLTSQIDAETGQLGYRDSTGLHVIRGGRVATLDPDVNASKNIFEKSVNPEFARTLRGWISKDGDSIYVLFEDNNSGKRKVDYRNLFGKAKVVKLPIGKHGFLDESQFEKLSEKPHKDDRESYSSSIYMDGNKLVVSKLFQNHIEDKMERLRTKASEKAHC